MVLSAKFGRYLYAIEPGADVSIKDLLFSFDGNIDVLGPKCEVLVSFRSPRTQTTILDSPTNAWNGIYQITIPAYGLPTVADTNKPAVDPSLTTIAGAVIDPMKADSSECPPLTLPGATPEGRATGPQLAGADPRPNPDRPSHFD